MFGLQARYHQARAGGLASIAIPRAQVQWTWPYLIQAQGGNCLLGYSLTGQDGYVCANCMQLDKKNVTWLTCRCGHAVAGRGLPSRAV